MSIVPITIACGNYDRTRPIRDGRVLVDGCDVTFLALEPEEVFYRAFRNQEFDVSELSFSSYIRTVAAGVSPYIAIPAFVSRIFRHSGIYVRSDRGINSPADLKGKLIGLPEYQITAVVWQRGMLQDEYGVKPSDIRWRTGGQEHSRVATSALRSRLSLVLRFNRFRLERPSPECWRLVNSMRCLRLVRPLALIVKHQTFVAHF